MLRLVVACVCLAWQGWALLPGIHSAVRRDGVAREMSMSSDGPLGFGEALSHSNVGFGLRTNVICGTNALEHGANLMEDQGLTNVLVLSGWNIARTCPLMWELEPREFNVSTFRIEHEVTRDVVTAIAETTRRAGARAIVAVGGGRVLDAGKAAAVLLEQDGVRLVTVPTVPGCGAELSRHTSLHVHAKPLSRRPAETVHGELGGANDGVHVQGSESESESVSESELERGAVQEEAVSQAPTSPAEPTTIAMKEYAVGREPDMCLVQASLFDRLPMEVMHERVVGLMATCIDVVLSDAGFVSELLAWDTLSTLTGVLDRSHSSATLRVEEWMRDPTDFTERTNFDAKEKHQSQYFRRYGHALGPQDVLALSKAAAAVSVASAGAGGVTLNSPSRLSALQIIADTLDASVVEAEDGYALRVASLLPTYLDVLHGWASADTDDSDAKKVTLFKLERVSRVLSTAACLSDGVAEVVCKEGDGAVSSRLDFLGTTARLRAVVESPLVRLLPMQDQRSRHARVTGLSPSLKDRQLYKVRIALKELCSGAPIAQVEVPLLRRLLLTPTHLTPLTAGQGHASPVAGTATSTATAVGEVTGGADGDAVLNAVRLNAAHLTVATDTDHH